MILKPKWLTKIEPGHWASKGLVGSWIFNEGGGDLVGDTSSNENNGTFVGNPQWVGGQDGLALDFDGAGDNIILTGMTASSQSYSLIMWVKATGTVTGQYLFDSESGRLLFAWAADAVTTLGFFDGSWKMFGENPRDGLWHQIVLILNDTTSEAICYVDAVQSGAIGDYSSNLSIGGAIRIGSRHSGTQEFNGQIGSVLFYDRALDGSEIRSLRRKPFQMFKRNL